MDTYLKLIKLGCFTREEVSEITGNLRTADSLIQSYKKRGWIVSVRRNLYVAMNPETDDIGCNPFEIGSKISSDATISHHTAFAFFGLTNQVFHEIYVSSESRFSSFDFDGHLYVPITAQNRTGIERYGRVRVTNLERTVVDSIKDFVKYGGFEELLNCLSMLTYVDESKLTETLRQYNNQFCWQKTGFLLSHFPNLRLSKEFFNLCKAELKKSVRYLYPDLKNEKHLYDSQWQLYIPKDRLNLPNGV